MELLSNQNSMNYSRILIAGIVIWIVSTIYIFLTCGWLFTWVYQIPPIIWLTPEAMMSTENLVGSLGTGLLSAFIFTLIYAILYKGLPYSGIKKGLIYGLLLWLITIGMGIIGMPFYMTIAWTVVIYWTINFLVGNLLLGLLVGAIYKTK